MIIFRTLSVGLSFTVLVLATLGVAATPMGWLASESLFINDEIRDNDPILAEIAELNRSPYRGILRQANVDSGMIQIGGVRINGPRLVFRRMVQPFRALFGGAQSIGEYFYYLFGCLWTVAVWSFVGLGICRVALLRMTRNERAGLDDAFEYGFAHYVSALLAILLPMIAVLVLCLPGFLLGLLMGLDWGTVVVGVLWFLVLGLSLLMGILLLGLMFGWPLMIASIACEGQNSFDAITRSFAYVFQRPVNYLFYSTIALVFGTFCWFIATQFTSGVIDLSFWSTGCGANRTAPDRIESIRRGMYWTEDAAEPAIALPPAATIPEPEGDADPDQPNQPETQAVPKPLLEPDSFAPVTQQPTGRADASSPDLPNDAADETNRTPSPTLVRGAKIISFWVGFAKTVCVAFIYGLFWCFASAIYLLLRYDVDETEMDEIHVIDQQRTYDLPPLKSDESGIPQIQPLPSDPTPSKETD